MKTKQKPRKPSGNKSDDLDKFWSPVFDVLDDLVFLMDTDFNLIRVNKSFTKLTGQYDKHITGKKCYELIHGAQDPHQKCPCRKALETQEPENKELYDSHLKKWFYMRLTPIFDKNRNLTGIIHMATDITERKKAEEEKERFLYDLTERVKELNCLYSLSKLVAQPDISVEEIFQKTVNLVPPSWQYPDITCSRIVFEEKEFKTNNFKATKWKQLADIKVSGKRTGTLEVCYLEEKPESYEGPFLKEERDLINAIVQRLGQIIEYKRAKDELESQAWGLKKTNEAIKLLYKELEGKNKQLKELDQLKSDFISTVSHELRTPLTSIREGVSLVIDETTGQINQDQQRFLSIAQTNIDRLARLINDLLDISRIEAGRIKMDRQLIDMVRTVKDVLETFKPQAAQKGLILEAKCPLKTCQIYADRDKMIQVFSNLINNALKFTEKGRITINGTDKGDYLQISVADTGKGIPKEELEAVFDKFKQVGRKTGPGAAGTGLGLAICRGIIEAHGGKIWAESQGKGKGSKFTFTLSKGLRKEGTKRNSKQKVRK